MRKPYDKINIVDIESTCWADKSPDKNLTTQVDPVSEIIEVGICQLDYKTLEITNKRSIPIKPILSSPISEFCTELTGWTDERLKDAGTFNDACLILEKEYNSRNIPWASWGDYDRQQFERDCKNKIKAVDNVKKEDRTHIESLGGLAIGGITLESTRYPFGRTHINLKAIYCIFNKGYKEFGVETAMKNNGLVFEGRPHSGVDDAYNIAKLFQLMVQDYRRDSY